MLSQAAKDAERLFWLRFAVAAIVLIVGTAGGVAQTLVVVTLAGRAFVLESVCG